MGGAADLPHRSSSPMKRRASDLEQDDVTAVQAPDVEMNAAEDVIAGSAQPEDRPPIDEQIRHVTSLLEAESQRVLQPGDKIFLVSKKWLARVQARETGAKVKPEDLVGDIGPIDNSDLIQEIITDTETNDSLFARLKPDVAPDSFLSFPVPAWDYIHQLYGIKEGQVPIMRLATNTNADENGIPNVQYELHPPVFTIHRLWSANSPVPVEQVLKTRNPKAPAFVMNRKELYVDALKLAKKVAYISPTTKVRVWRMVKTLPTGQTSTSALNRLSPPPSRSNTPAPESDSPFDKLLIEVDRFIELEKGTERELVDIPDHSANPNYNGRSFNIDMAGLGSDLDLVLDEHVEKESYLTNYVPTGSVPFTSIRNVQPRGQSTSGRNSPAPSGPMTRGRTQKSGRTLGTVGLSNLGNTCYMNSALQCVRSVEELTKYFLTDQADEELNPDNPLGNHGHVAIEYSRLLKDIYREGAPNSVTPRSFKQTIGRYAPSFSGYGQQDSQEFLGFLLDGLQEDLSRIKKKPYIEKPDSTDEMVGNPEAIREMADKVWDITKRRDDSVIADLFTGMYKSTLVCPVCSKVSITFDPFNNLTLQLPIESVWRHDVFYLPINGPVMIIAVELDKQASIKAMKQFISKRVNVPIEKLFVAEVWKSKFYKFTTDLSVASEEFMDNDQITVYELESAPTNCSPKKSKPKFQRSLLETANNYDIVPNWDDPMSERMLVPVIHRKQIPDPPRYKKPWEFTLYPHFIVLTPEEARSEDIIRRKVLEKLAPLTTYPPFHEDADTDEVAESNDSDIVVTSSSDADSSGDGKVLASSVDGEDDVVDVTMKESNGTAVPAKSHPQPSADTSASRRPRWIDPKEQLVPELQNMFDLKFFSNTRELIPIGWNGVEEDKEYPLLSSRDPRFEEATEETPEEEEDQFSRNNRSGSITSDEDEELPLERQPQTQTRMNDESSDEDELGPMSNIRRTLPVRSRAHKFGSKVRYARNSRGLKTYSRKGTQPAAQYQDSFHDDSEDASDDGPLVRLGEGLIVDWSADAWETVFDGQNGDTMRGQATFNNCSYYDDPELNAKRQARDRRRKKGITLDECLDEFGKEEILSEQDTWYCPRCKEHRRASKKFELWKTPDILVMHLKRFSSSGMRRDKLDVEVDFPLEGLDLTSRVIASQEGKVEIYDLFAVDDHWGGLGGGHYTAFAKSFIDGEWYEYNDSSATKLRDTSNIVSKGAYLLFYRRRSDVPLGGERFKEIVDRYDNPPQPEDEDQDEPGEGLRLDGGSSLHGSSSALIGVGAAHQADGLGGGQKNRGLLSGGNVNASAIENLPSYSEHLSQDDGAPLLAADADMNDGIEVDSAYASTTHNPLTQPNWTWNNLSSLDSGIAAPSGIGSETAFDSERSDIVQHDSSVGEDSLKERQNDFNTSTADYGEDFEPPAEIPDMDEDAEMFNIGLTADLAETATRGLEYNNAMVNVNSADDEDDDEPATEIHVEEGEGLSRK